MKRYVAWWIVVRHVLLVCFCICICICTPSANPQPQPPSSSQPPPAEFSDWCQQISFDLAAVIDRLESDETEDCESSCKAVFEEYYKELKPTPDQCQYIDTRVKIDLLMYNFRSWVLDPLCMTLAERMQFFQQYPASVCQMSRQCGCRFSILLRRVLIQFDQFGVNSCELDRIHYRFMRVSQMVSWLADVSKVVRGPVRCAINSIWRPEKDPDLSPYLSGPYMSLSYRDYIYLGGLQNQPNAHGNVAVDEQRLTEEIVQAYEEWRQSERASDTARTDARGPHRFL
ncbi:hypothetical protein BCR37DRAFT_112619 [Protomyces lactucae-debilis]|uniref:Uncharacterized protein n=1 Tax=Protomyces lactucae-debilis TaxID=2754530 RepID=A0A1Y2F3P6_PROLT|nr:uncharacterized protein BCR37DRAFT_112619 [Protomyces lactucae-debilis]ORY78114.1 hypothetical protein BCR37DRAFT_112619 [Protomyces lactucae-debilis]